MCIAYFSSVDYLSHTCVYSETLQVVTCRSPAETIDNKGTALQKDTWASWTRFYTRVKYLMRVHLWVGIPTTQGWVCIGYVRNTYVCTTGTCGPCMESGCYRWMGFYSCNRVQRLYERSFFQVCLSVLLVVMWHSYPIPIRRVCLPNLERFVCMSVCLSQDGHFYNLSNDAVSSDIPDGQTAASVQYNDDTCFLGSYFSCFGKLIRETPRALVNATSKKKLTSRV